MTSLSLAVTDLGFWKPNKRDLLWFDQVAIGSLAEKLPDVQDQSVRVDLEYLASEGAITSYRYKMSERKGKLYLGEREIADVDLDQPVGGNVEEQAAICGLAVYYISVHGDRPPKSAADFMVFPIRLNVGKKVDQWQVARQAELMVVDLQRKFSGSITPEKAMGDLSSLLTKATLRSVTAEFNLVDRCSATSIMPSPSEEHLLMGGAKQADVASLVLKELPVPDELTPWEAILEFRRDEQTKRHLSRLKRWSRGAARRLLTQAVSNAELEDEIEEMLQNYRDHMKVFKMKAQATLLENLVTLGAGALEDIAKLKLESLASRFFQVRHQRIALMGAELKAPGRELAYIANAQERFGAI